jgi:hypothetical protein
MGVRSEWASGHLPNSGSAARVDGDGERDVAELGDDPSPTGVSAVAAHQIRMVDHGGPLQLGQEGCVPRLLCWLELLHRHRPTLFFLKQIDESSESASGS